MLWRPLLVIGSNNNLWSKEEEAGPVAGPVCLSIHLLSTRLLLSVCPPAYLRPTCLPVFLTTFSSLPALLSKFQSVCLARQSVSQSVFLPESSQIKSQLKKKTMSGEPDDKTAAVIGWLGWYVV